jgi:hypothetical protein
VGEKSAIQWTEATWNPWHGCPKVGARVPVFVKQLGASPYYHNQRSVHIDRPGVTLHIASLEHKKGGDITEWPEYLRVREYPKMEATA